MGRISVAPMMGWTDKHMLRLLQLVAPRVQLYTQMVNCAEVVHGERERLQRAHGGVNRAGVRRVALQLGGRDPAMMGAAAAECVERFGYGEININVGCPSGRVASGSFGAALMREPERVGACADAIAEHCAARSLALPGGVTVKCRLGVRSPSDCIAAESDAESARIDASVRTFVATVAESGVVTSFVVHAREAVLGGLGASTSRRTAGRFDPSYNRTVPPLHHSAVGRLARDFPKLLIEANGGLTTLRAAADLVGEWPALNGVMLGRAAMADPFVLREALDAVSAERVWGASNGAAAAALDVGDGGGGGDEADTVAEDGYSLLGAKNDAARGYADYVEGSARRGLTTPDASAHALVRPAMNLFASMPGARRYRRSLAAAAVDGSAIHTAPERASAVADSVRRAVDELQVDVAAAVANAAASDSWAANNC